MRALVAAVAALLLITASAHAGVPTATTGGANTITQTSAKLTGSVKPNKENTTWHFEYGPTTAYGTSTPEQGPVVAGAGNTNVSADVGGLTAGTTYHYRLVATNPSGSVPGKDRTFTTRPGVSIATSATTVRFNRSETIKGQVSGSAIGGITVTLQENPYPFAGFNDVATTTTDAAGNYQFIRPVTTNTAYRVVAQTRPPGTSATAFVYEQDTVSLKVSSSRPRRGRSVLFTGFSQPARVGGPVYVQRLGRHGWRTVLTAKLAPTTVPNSASYSIRLKGRKVVSGVYRAYVPGGFDHVAGASPTKRITVRR
ncbi:MAG: hypothetical protein ACJ76Z_12345 [Thermoleophilaceae bacterium]